MESSKNSFGKLLKNIDESTILIANSISFSHFGPEYNRDNFYGNGSEDCEFIKDPHTDKGNGCRIFKLANLIGWAGGNSSRLVNAV